MEKLNFIPGDFVVCDKYQPSGIYKVIACYPNRTLEIGRNVICKGKLVLHCETDKAGVLPNIVSWENNVTPIHLTTDILKKNGWAQTRHTIDEDGFEWYEYENDNSELPEIQYYPKDDNMDEHFSVFWGDAEILYDIHFVHQLQHVLFGLDIDVEFKI